MPDLSFEEKYRLLHHGMVAGVDEAGRGPLAGPVVAAAVILDPACVPDGVNDSKKLTATKRAKLYAEILACAQVGIGIASVAEIDEHNILWATMLAMERAVDALPATPAFVLVDGNRCPKWQHKSEALVGGDARSLSIGAASIIAKEHRDAMMIALDAEYPGYGWASNKGYGAKVHMDGLRTLGPTPHHRKSFAPVAQAHFDFGASVVTA